MKRDIFSCTNSCMDCQLRARALVKDRVPIEPIVRPALPFTMCHADLIGPLEPPAKQHKYALCVIDDCTRWPAVYLLKSDNAKAVCDAFLELFSLVGWPEVVCILTKVVNSVAD